MIALVLFLFQKFSGAVVFNVFVVVQPTSVFERSVRHGNIFYRNSEKFCPAIDPFALN